MSNLENKIPVLRSAIKNQNFQIQIEIINDFLTCFRQNEKKETIIQDILIVNLGQVLNDVISSQLSILLPTMKLIRHLMQDFHFRNYQFIHLFKNILRVLIMFVQKNTLEHSQLEFFEVVNHLNVLLKKFLVTDSLQRNEEELQTVFVSLLKFIELVNYEKCIPLVIKHLSVDCYFHLLSLNETLGCIFKNFEFTMQVYNLADVFLDYYFEKYIKDTDQLLWLFKIIEILFWLLKSCNETDELQLKCFENVFYNRMGFVIEQTMILYSSSVDSELFKSFISIINVILWTPCFSNRFRTKILNKVLKLKADSIIFMFSRSSRKISKYSQYTAKLILTAFVVHSNGPSSSITDKHLILKMFLETRLPKSIINLTPSQLIKRSGVLILLYGCSFFRKQLRTYPNSNRILENLVIILKNQEDILNDDEICNILRIFSYFYEYSILNPLEYAGVQKISEFILAKASDLVLDSNRRYLHPADKYSLRMAEEFAPNTKILNTLILSYLSQHPSLTSSKIGHTIPTSQILHFICSTDYNQVVNAVKILKKKHLKEDELDFIVMQCLGHLKSEEIVIEGALVLIDKNSRSISASSVWQIFKSVIAFLEAKQEMSKFTKQSYFLMMRTCVNLVRFALNVDMNFEQK